MLNTIQQITDYAYSPHVLYTIPMGCTVIRVAIYFFCWGPISQEYVSVN
jgi:hypothetical protein